jgi:hypothetical protein
MKLYDYLKNFTIHEITEKIHDIGRYIENKISIPKEFIEHLKRDKKYHNDYFFWEMNFHSLAEIPNGEELYKKKKFDKILEEFKILYDRIKIHYDLYNKFYNDIFIDFYESISMIGIEIPEEFSLKKIERQDRNGKPDKYKPQTKSLFELINLDRYIQIITERDDYNVKYILKKIDEFIKVCNELNYNGFYLE